LVVRYINGYYLYWYHLLIMQVVYVTHAMDVWIRGEDNVIPEYIPFLTWFFIGSSAWVMTMYLTIYKSLAMVWVILGFLLVFWSADSVWRLGGPHGLEAQILLVVFNLLVTYVLCYRLWEALSPLIRKEEAIVSTDDEEVPKIRLNLKASTISLFMRSNSDPRPIAKTKKKKQTSRWNSEWALVNSEDDGERECPGPNRRLREEGGVFQVETQILSDYDGSSDDDAVIMHIQESDEAPLSPRETPVKPVKQLIALSESRGITQQQQERLECDPLLSHKDETTNSQQATVPLLRSIETVTPRETDIVEESKNSERPPPHMKSVTPSKQANYARHTTAELTQSQDKPSTVSEVELNKIRSKTDKKVADQEPEDTL